MNHTSIKSLHLLALGLWFGGAGFFNFVTAPSLFSSFEEVVRSSPSDRTAFVAIVPAEASADTRKNLASALAGAAVGPVFPKYFALQAICGIVALATALCWWPKTVNGSVHRWRVYLLTLALLSVALGWPLSSYVSEVRLQRFDADPEIASAARAAFGSAHLVSLFLSMFTILLAGIALAMAAKLPELRASGE